MDNLAEISLKNPTIVDNLLPMSDDTASYQGIGVSRGGRATKIHALVCADGKPVALMLSPGNINDCSVAEHLLALTDISEKTILGDKAYGTKDIINYILQNGATFCIPPKSNTKQPWEFDEENYKERNIVERFFNRIKQFRAIATRYDKLAKRFFGFVLLASVMVLLN